MCCSKKRAAATAALLTCCLLLFSLSPAAQEALDPKARADKVIVYKGKRQLQLLRKGEVLKTYKIALGANPVGPKTRAGDKRTPEGSYVLDYRNPQSKFHLSIHISYPNAQDRANAAKLGVSPGGDIFLHGLPNGYSWLGASHRLHDWTDGCIAVTDEEIEEIWRAVPNGTPIEIKP